MLSKKRRLELEKKIKYKLNGGPKGWKKILRRNRYIFSLIAKVRMFYSRYISSMQLRNRFLANKELFFLNEEQKEHVSSLQRDGITILENYFSEDYIDSIQKKLDKNVKDLKIQDSSYHISHGRIDTLRGLTYEEIEFIEDSVAISNPYQEIEELVDIAFHENFLKIITNYLGFIPLHQAGAQRAFPHYPPIESSFFHKDADDHDVLHIFVYLVDVDEKTGPFCYIPGSHTNDPRSFGPRTNYDLGIEEDYGRISDKEVEKYYQKSEWLPIKAKRGSVVITHVNGLHKGPMWGDFGAENKTRDIINVNFRGMTPRIPVTAHSIKISEKSVKDFSPLQKLFLEPNYEVVQNY